MDQIFSATRIAAAIALGAVISALLACDPPGSGRDPAAKTRESACQAFWKQASTDNSGRLSPSDAVPYTTNFSVIDTNEDGFISHAEFMTGCHAGSINSAQFGSEKAQSPEIVQIFAGFPPGLDRRDYQRCDPATRRAIKTWALAYMKRVGRVSASWNSIDELYAVLWSSEGMKNGDYDHARALVMNTGDYLRFVRDEFRTHDNEQFTDKERNMWRTHLDELGASPLFLLAFRDKQRFGDILDDMHEKFRDHLTSRPALNCAVLALDPADRH